MSAICLVQSTSYYKTQLLLNYIKKEIYIFDNIWLLSSDYEKEDFLEENLSFIIKDPGKDIPRFLASECYRSSCLYLLLSDSLVHIRAGALGNLLSQHAQASHRVSTCLTPLDYARSGYLLQVMGILPDLLLQPWTPNYIDEYRFENPDARAEAHEQYLMGLDQPHWGNFGTYHLQPGETLPETGFCWMGKIMQEIFQQNERSFKGPGEMFTMIAKATGQTNALCGSAWAANLKKDMESHYMHRYRALATPS